MDNEIDHELGHQIREMLDPVACGPNEEAGPHLFRKFVNELELLARLFTHCCQHIYGNTEGLSHAISNDDYVMG
jgi:hypothetical protein